MGTGSWGSAAGKQRTGRLLVVLWAALFGLVFAQSGQAAAPDNDDALAIKSALTSLTSTLDGLAGHGILADAVPLTGLDPTSTSGLNLADVLNALPSNLGSEFTEADPLTATGREAIRDAIEDIDDGGLTVGSVNIVVGCPGTATSCSTPNAPVTVAQTPDGKVDLTIPVRATRSVAPTVSFSTNVADLTGGTLNADLVAALTIPVRYDPTLRTTAPAQAVSLLVTPTTPSLDLSASLTSATASLSANIGITDVTAALSGLNVNVGLGARLVDPDGNGRITQDEWSATALNDLTTLSRSGNAAGTLTFDTGLTSATNPDLSVPFNQALNTTTGFSFPSVSLGSLASFTNVTPEQIVSGLASAAAAIAGSQGQGDAELPFLDGSISDIARAAQPLVDFVDKQAVVCGTTDATPPSGSVERLTAGTDVFCQAFVSQAPVGGTVTWTVPAGTPAATIATGSNTTGADADGTVGPTPTKRAKFRMNGTGRFDAKAAYQVLQNGTNVNKTSERPPSSVQQLVTKLAQLGGFDPAPDGVGSKIESYDSATQALRFHLKRTFDPGAAAVAYDFGDQLEKASGVVGLQVVGTPAMSATADDITIDITFGVLLGALSQIGTGQPCPDPTVTTGPCPTTELDRFFVEVNPTAPELKVQDASFTATLPTLKGRLGFLDVTATTDALTVSRATTTDPLFRLDVNVPAGGLNVGTATLANAVRLRELLFKLPQLIPAPQLNLQMSGGINVTAKAGATALGSGRIGIAWPNVTTGLPTVTADTSFTDQLSKLNLSPNLFGTHDAATASGTTLTHSTATFTAAIVGKRLENMTDGSFCTVTAQTATTATCTLAGGADNQWQQGDEYRIEVGDPLAMLWLLLDNLDDVVEGLDGLTGGAAGDVFIADLPFVGMSARDLFSQVDDLRRTLTELRGGPGPSIECGTQKSVNTADGTTTNHAVDTVPPVGDPSQLGGASTIYCAATTPKPATGLTWSATGGAIAPANVSKADTVGTSPTKTVPVAIAAPGNIASDENTNGYRVRLSYTDVDGDHTVEYPSVNVPLSLAKLGTAIENKLGLPAGTIVFGTSDTGGTRKITIGLNYRRCTGFGADPTAFCDGQAPNASPLNAPLNVGLGSAGSIASVGAAADVQVAYNAAARLDLAIPVSTTPSVEVLPTSGLTLKGRFDAANIDLQANLGPIGIKAGINGKPTGDGAGVLKIGADFRLNGPATASSPSAWLGGLDANFTAPPDQTCGTLTLDDNDPTTATDPTTDLEGLACGRVAVGFVKPDNSVEYLSDVGFEADLAADNKSFTVTPEVPPALTSKLASMILDWDMLLRALPDLLTRLEEGLEASANSGTGNSKLPIVGDALDAGADIVNKVNTGVVTPTIDAIGPVLDTATEPSEVKSKIRTFLFEKMGPSSSAKLLRRGFADNTAPTESDIVVDLECGTGVMCTDLFHELLHITDVHVRFNVGQATGTPQNGVPFDVGLDGLPIKVAGSVTSQVGWNLVVDLGLNRDGPYLVVDDGSGTRKELQVQASVGLGEDATVCSSVIDDPTTGSITTAIPTFTASNRCLAGQLGFVGVNLRDNATTPSGLTLTAFLDLTREGGGAKLTLSDLVGGKLQAAVGITANAGINVRFRTGVPSDQLAGFPSVVGTFSAGWSWDSTVPGTLAPPTVSFGNLHLDASAFVQKYLAPTLAEIRNVTGPFGPVADTLTAPLPVISDLAALVGKPPITLLSLMEAVSGNNLTVIKTLAAFIQFANNPIVADGLIPLGNTGAGSFNVDANAAKTPKGPNDANSLISGGGNKGSALFSKPAVGGNNSQMTSRVNAAKPATQDNLPGTFGVPGLTFPFMEDAGQIFGFLMGQDITLIRFEVGRLRATAGFNYDFGPFFIGPVPVTAGVGGSVTLSGRFAIGYDTSGIRKVLAGGSGVHLFDGIFIDDLDSSGVDVPEVSLVGEVYARAAVTVFIASAGIEGGLRFTLDLNLDDTPQPDGKLRIEEVFNKLSNPICLFEVHGQLDLFLRFFLEINYFVGSERWDFTIVELTLLEFSAACTPPKPKLANLTGGVLTLNVGSEEKRKARQVAVDTRHEKVIVRPAGGGRYSVEAFGVYQVYGPGAPFPGDPITKVVAHADDGNDTIALEPGKDENANLNNPTASIPFTAVGEIHGGAETDTISGGDAADTLRGDAGNDKINGGKGGDDIRGGSEADNIDGGPGNDTIGGNDGADRISGGPGTDDVNGGGHDDFLSGGPGTDPAVSSNPAESRDLNDTLTGGDGRDQLDGGFGDDDMYGDEPVTCTVDGSLANDDLIDGGAGDDNMWGGAGNDTLVGGVGHDDLCGNAGDDDLDGDNPDLDGAGGGNDTFDGGKGSDEVYGRSGHDVATGGANRDKVDGGIGNDDLRGGAGRDLVTGAAGLDVIVGDDAAIASSDKAARSSATQAARVALVSGEGSTDSGTAACGFAQGGSGSTDTGTADCLQGGADHDVLFGEGGADHVFGDDGEDWESGGSGADVMRGGKDADVMYGNAGNDEMHGDSGADRMFGNDDVDTMRGGIDADYMEGNNHADVMNGDGDADKMVGGSASASAADGADTMHGDAANDVMIGDNGVIAADGTATMSDGGAGTFGNDTITGDGNDDRIYGHLGGDTIDGNTGHDYVVGDMGSITPGTPTGAWPGGAPIYAVALVDADKGGVDTVKGGDGNDHVYAGAAGDTVEGNAGDDYVEGNGGDDSIYGFNATVDDGVVQASDTADRLTMSLVGDQDDLIGGSSTAVDGRTTTPDTGEALIAGNGDHDVITGDNADVTRVVDTADATQWADDPIIPDARARTVVLRDREKTGADLAAVSGNDVIVGNDGSDRAYGEGGQDCIKGNANDDFLEGNQDVDCIEGNDGEDDIVGGSSTEVGGSPGVGDPDSGDFLHGGAGADVIAADNATIARSALTDATFQTDGRWLGVVAARWVKLLDVTTLDATRFGADAVSGGQGADIAFGQDGDDWISGGSQDDHIQGNGGVDNVFGDRLLSDASVTGDPTLPASLTGCPSADAAQLDGAQGAAGQDDIVGGSERAGQRDTGDTIFGDGGEDFAIGDNGTLYRTITAGAYVTTLHKYGNDGEGFVRTVTLFDREKTGTALAAVSGGDRIEGNDGGDRLFGEGGDDSVKGNNHDDYAEGDQGRDWVEGNDGQDDLVGGSSFALGGAGLDAQRSDPDDGDFLYGGEGHDVVAGDNAVVARTASEAGTPVYFTTDGRLLEPTDRWIRLYDLDSLRAGAFGGDLISGGQAVDVGFGQDGDDWLSGGSEGDYLEGNGANDRFYGDRLPSDATVAGVPAVPASLAGMSSGQPQLDGVQGPHGQDDIVGGSLLAGHRDGNDRVSGDGAQDFVLGDNGSLVRELLGAVYGTYTSAEDTARIRRNAQRFDVATPASAGVWGNDVMEGNAGDDAVWGQDGNDELWGNGEDDDLFGELGNDRAFGGPGEDSLIGDRGGVTNTLVTAAMMADPNSPFYSYTISTPSPPFVTFHAFKGHPLDRRVDLLNEAAGSVGGPFTGNRVITHNGRDEGGHDLLRGGADHDSLHGTFGDDLVNGDSGGDYVYGDDGSDVMWGGRGSNDPANTADRGGAFDSLVDYVFGGHGGNPANDSGVVTGGADILDYIPRVGTDPQSWHDAVATYNDLDGNVEESLRQHNQGIDWVYGGWDRDVMQANMEKVGPNDGDRLIDWTGAYNLYTHCSPDYGGYNDIRAISPQMLDFLQRLAYATGVGSSISAVMDPATSAYRELALVYQKTDVKLNSGKDYPTTPGHFENIACSQN